MANISTYPIGTPAAGDLIPATQKVTDANGNKENRTRNFTVQSLGSLINTGFVGGYTVYTALLTQAGTAAPVATVLQNTTGGTIAWTRNSTGRYIATISGKTYTANKTAIFLTSGATGATDGAFLKVENSGNTTIQAFYNYDTATNTAIDGVVTGSAIEIRIYN
jgi:hypothetical protein